METMDALKTKRAYEIRLVQSNLLNAMRSMKEFSSHFELSDEERNLQLECKRTVLELDSLFRKLEGLSMKYYCSKIDAIEI